MRKIILISFFYLIMALVVNKDSHFIIFPLAIFCMIFLNFKLFRFFLRWKFLLFLGILVFAIPIFLGYKDSIFIGIPYSSALFLSGIMMAERSIILLLGLKFLVTHISVEQILSFLTNSHFYGFSQVFSLSMKALPEIKKIIAESYQEFKQISNGKNFLLNITQFPIKFTVRVLRYAENISEDDLLKEISHE